MRGVKKKSKSETFPAGGGGLRKNGDELSQMVKTRKGVKEGVSNAKKKRSRAIARTGRHRSRLDHQKREGSKAVPH